MEIEGEIQNIKSNRKAFTINNIWYNSFKPLTNEFNKGDFVKLTYVKHGDFNNIRSLNKIKQDIPEELEILDLTNTDKNCILICAKDLYINEETKSLREWIKELKGLRNSI